jgi:hypothetical protein
LFVLLVACKKDPPSDVDEAYACAHGDVAACDRRNAKRFSVCEATRDAAPCVEAAVDIYKGHTSGPGGEGALAHFVKACEMGGAEGCLWAGRLEKDRAKKQGYFERGCELRAAPACELRAECFLGQNAEDREAGVCPRDHARAKALYLRACELERGTTIGCKGAELVDRLSR